MFSFTYFFPIIFLLLSNFNIIESALVLSFTYPFEFSGVDNITIDATCTNNGSPVSGTYIWTITTSSTSVSKVSSLNSHLASVTGSHLNIPYLYLDIGAEYSVTAAFNDGSGGTATLTKTIRPICPKKTYWVSGSGCSGNCITGCDECIDGSTCAKCAPYASLNSGTQQCEMNSFLNITVPSPFNTCTKLVLSVVINPYEYTYSQLNFTWSVVNDITGVVSTNLTQAVAAATGPILTIPAEYFAVGVSYTFTASYTNLMGQSISNQASVTSSTDDLPSLQVEDGGIQYMRRNKGNLLRLFPIYSGCYTPISTTTVWAFLNSGQNVINSDLSNKNPLWMYLPSCSMAAKDVYIYNLYSFGTQFNPSNIPLQINVLDDIFEAKILNGNRYHSVSSDLTLTGKADFGYECSDVNKTGLTYTWTCTKLGVACTDANSIFGVAASTGSLTVPSSYFAAGDQMKFKLVITRGTLESHTTTLITISGATTMAISITCDPEPCSGYYTRDNPPYLVANYEGKDNSQMELNLTWSVTPLLKFHGLRNRVYFNYDLTTTYTSSKMRITVVASNSTSSGQAFLDLDYNSAPRSGSMTITPKIGQAFSTYFWFRTYGWVDADAPLTYQYYYNDMSTTDSVPLSTSLRFPELFSQMPASPTGSQFDIIMVVSDYYGATTFINDSIVVTNSVTTITDMATAIKTLMNNITSPDPSEVLNLLSLYSRQILLFEVRDSPASCGTSCSSHGTCSNNRCTCDDGFKAGDCSLTTQQMTSIIALKNSMMTTISTQIINIFINDMTDTALNVLNHITQNYHYNDQTTRAAAANISLRLATNNLTSGYLSVNARRSLMSTAANIITSIARDDCSCSTSQCQDFYKNLLVYFDSVAASSTQKIKPDYMEIYSNDVFDFVVAQISVCEVADLFIQLPSGDQNITFNLVAIQRDCSQIVAVKLFALQDRSTLFNCDTPFDGSSPKSVLGVNMYDAVTKQNLTTQFSLEILKPSPKTCPDSCSFVNEGGVLKCTCLNILDFDPSKQLGNLFSFVQPLTNQKVGLVNWNYMKSAVFFGNIIIVVWFCLTLLLLQIPGVNHYNITEYVKRASFIRATIATLVSRSDLTKIYYVKVDDMSKTARAIGYFSRLALFSFFSAIFERTTLKIDFNDLFNNLEIFPILLPFWILIPISFVINFILKAVMKKSALNGSNLHKKVFLIFLVVLSFGLIFGTILIAANNGRAWSGSWGYIFGINLFVDLVLCPFVIWIYDYNSYVIKYKDNRPSVLELYAQKENVNRVGPIIVNLEEAKGVGRGDITEDGNSQVYQNKSDAMSYNPLVQSPSANVSSVLIPGNKPKEFTEELDN